MNERIKELAEQAEKFADDNFKGEPNWSEAYESKFVELIVRECADIATIRQYEAYSAGHYVLKHFGIEGENDV